MNPVPLNDLQIKNLQTRIEQSEIGSLWLKNPLLERDIWSMADLGYTPEDLISANNRNIYFEEIELPWLKLLTKLTVLVLSNERKSCDTIRKFSLIFRRLSEFLIENSSFKPQDISNQVLQEFISQSKKSSQDDRKRHIRYATQLWAEESWLQINYIHIRDKGPKPKNQIIPEEVLIQVYENLELFPPMLERLIRLQIALGARIGEILKLNRHCLKHENEQWQIQRWIGKRKIWKYFPIHPLIAELIQEQQRFLSEQFGNESDFDKLFCWLSVAPRDGAKQPHAHANRFEIEPVYRPQILQRSMISFWLRDFSKQVKIKDKKENLFELTTHMFRRTKASIMAYCEAEDEYIAAVLGHASLAMLPHYRKRSLDRLEKEAKTKGYVDMYGNLTTFKPKKRRYEKLATLMKVSTPLGECHRPKMLGDCQYRYACLRYTHHRVTLQDKAQIEADLEKLQVDLQQAQSEKAERRITEIMSLKALLEKRLNGLDKIENLSEEMKDVS